MESEVFRLNAQIELRHWWFVSRRTILHKLVRRVVAPSPQTLVVDVGCGTGGNLAALSADYACLGIDPCAEAIELARQRFPQVRFVCGQAPGGLGTAAREARLYLLTDVLEHVPDDRGLMTQLLAAASPGAYFLVTVPADMSLWSPHDVVHGHYRRYQREQFADLWHDLPAASRLVSYFNTRLYWPIRVVRAMTQWLGKSYGSAGTDLRMPWAPLNGLLKGIMAGEGRVLLDAMDGEQKHGFARGASLIALVQKTEPATIELRPRQTPDLSPFPNERAA